MKLDMIGKEYETKTSGKLRIVDYVSSSNVTVEFIATGYQTKTTMNIIRDGNVKDKLFPSVYGVGYLGDKYKLSEKGVRNKQGELWMGLMTRCYNKKLHERFPTYIGCEVSDYFKNFSNFYDWCLEQKGFGLDGYELDKDLLVKGNKVYSESTCVFIPKFLNSILTKANKTRGKYLLGVYYDKHNSKFKASIAIKGKHKSLGYFDTEADAHLAYKVAKENYIKEVAEEYKDLVDERVYHALMNYQVDETD